MGVSVPNNLTAFAGALDGVTGEAGSRFWLRDLGSVEALDDTVRNEGEGKGWKTLGEGDPGGDKPGKIASSEYFPKFR